MLVLHSVSAVVLRVVRARPLGSGVQWGLCMCAVRDCLLGCACVKCVPDWGEWGRACVSFAASECVCTLTDSDDQA